MGTARESQAQSPGPLAASTCAMLADAAVHQPEGTQGRHLRAWMWEKKNVGYFKNPHQTPLPISVSLFLGENNANYNRDLYACTFPALIADWRQTFHYGSRGQTERFFPFGFVQVCAQRKGVYGHVWTVWAVCMLVQGFVAPRLPSPRVLALSCILIHVNLLMR